MPLYEFGYRDWDGERRPRALRFWSIARHGIYLASSSKMLKRFLLFALFPISYFAFIFFVIGIVTDPTSGNAHDWAVVIGGFWSPEVANLLIDDPIEARRLAWTLAFYSYFASVQTWVVMVVVAIVGPPLIAQDIRSKAFLIYFSKPINRWDYIVGKASTVMAYLLMITLLPAVILAILAVAMASDIQAVWQILPLLPKLFAAAMIVAVPCTCVILLLSSLTNYERFAMFAWLFIWIGGVILYAILSSTAQGSDIAWLRYFSLYDTTIASLTWLFDLEGLASRFQLEQTLEIFVNDSSRKFPGRDATIFLGALSLTCVAILARRVSAPARV